MFVLGLLFGFFSPAHMHVWKALPVFPHASYVANTKTDITVQYQMLVSALDTQVYFYWVNPLGLKRKKTTHASWCMMHIILLFIFIRMEAVLCVFDAKTFAAVRVCLTHIVCVTHGLIITAAGFSVWSIMIGSQISRPLSIQRFVFLSIIQTYSRVFFFGVYFC